MAAIKLLEKLRREGRQATPAEQEVLALYVGWGGLKGAFPDSDGKFGKGLEKVGRELRELLTDEEYALANRSVQYAHYTSEKVARFMWAAVERMGFDGGLVLEPGMGTGNFAGTAPFAAPRVNLIGVEMDPTTAAIAAQLYPKWRVRNEDFTRAVVGEGRFDLAIGNPPFSAATVPLKGRKHVLHDYFILKSLHSLRPGAVAAFVTSAGTMNKASPRSRQAMAEVADFVGGVRLPSDAFAASAGTEVTTDVLFFRRRLPGEEPGPSLWTETTEATLPGRDGEPTSGTVNAWFAANPDMVLGEETFADTLTAGERYAVTPSGDLQSLLDAALERIPAGVMTPAPDAAAASQEGEADWDSPESKEGSYYIAANGRVMQHIEGAGWGVPGHNKKGMATGKSKEQMALIRGYVRIRDALRAVMAANVAADAAAGDAARAELRRVYQAFVARFGPINRKVTTESKPQPATLEKRYAEAYELARTYGEPVRHGDFNPEPYYRQKKSYTEIAAARAAARKRGGAGFDEGSLAEIFTNPEPVRREKYVNHAVFAEDPEALAVLAIEELDGAEWVPGRVFTEDIIAARAAPRIDSAEDAVFVSLDQRGRFDIKHVAKIWGRSVEETVEALGDKVFENPRTGKIEMADEYLSGPVRDKLREAREAALRDPKYERNVRALEAVQPEPVPTIDIQFGAGAAWMGSGPVNEFLAELGWNDPRATYHANEGWRIGGKAGAAAEAQWGTRRKDAGQVALAALNRSDLKVTDPVPGSDKRTVNPEETDAARRQAARMRQAFDDWARADPERAAALTDLYNETLNGNVARRFEARWLTTPGVESSWVWRPYQIAAIVKAIMGGSTYLNHHVGAGKTSTAVGIVMEGIRLGRIKKGLIVVPKHVLVQFGREFVQQYPRAKVLLATEDNIGKRRTRFLANAATGDWDAVIMSYETFAKIPMSKDFVNRKVAEMSPGYAAGADGRAAAQRQVETAERRLGQAAGGDDQVMTFEEMGFDALVVDEAQRYRKLDFPTQQREVKGIDPFGPQDSIDLMMKVAHLRETGGLTVFMSGTPVSNTLAEVFSLQRLFQPDRLLAIGADTFDSWSATFGEQVAAIERKPNGRYEAVTRFAKFVNVPELKAMLDEFMDYVGSAELDSYVTRPKVKYGIHAAKMSKWLAAFQRELERRADEIAARTGRPVKGDDIILNVINDAWLAMLDPRLVDPSYTPEPDAPSKLDLAVDEIHKIWLASKETPLHTPTEEGYAAPPVGLGPGAQMVFVERGLGKDLPWRVPDHIKRELIRRGVPESEIAEVGDHDTTVAKQRLFNDVNEGKVRIVIGSVAKMGTGVNAQRQLVAIHLLDALWLPTDHLQRVGRIHRQGNMNPEVAVHQYVTEESFDEAMWGIMLRKLDFIQALFSGGAGREVEDVSRISQMEEVKAIAAASPLVMEIAKAKDALTKAEAAQRAREQGEARARQASRDLRAQADWQAGRQINLRRDLELREDISGDKFRLLLEGEWLADRRRANSRIATLAAALQKGGRQGWRKVGEAGGFGLEMAVGGDGQPLMRVALSGGAFRPVTVGPDTVASISHRIASLDKLLDDAAKAEADARSELEALEARRPAEDPDGEGGAERVAALRREIRGLELRLEGQSMKRLSWEGAEGADGQPALRPKDGQLDSAEDAMASAKAEVGPAAERHYEAVELAAGGWGVRRRSEPAQPADVPSVHLSVAPRAAAGMDAEAAQARIAPIIADWADGPDVRVVDRAEDLPAHLRDAAADAGDVEGLYDAGEQAVWLVASNLAPERVERVLAHEAVGHYGVARILGEDAPAFFDAVHRAADGDPVLRRVRDGVIRDYGGDIDPATLGAEVTARLAEGGEAARPLLRRLAGHVRRFLRALGFKLRLTHQDVLALIDSAAALLRAHTAASYPDLWSDGGYQVPRADFGPRVARLAERSGRGPMPGRGWEELVRAPNPLVRPFELDTQPEAKAWLDARRSPASAAEVAEQMRWPVVAERVGDVTALLGGGVVKGVARETRLGPTLHLESADPSPAEARAFVGQAVADGWPALSWPKGAERQVRRWVRGAPEDAGPDRLLRLAPLERLRLLRTEPMYSRRPYDEAGRPVDPWHRQPLDRLVRQPFRLLGGLDDRNRWVPAARFVGMVKAAKDGWTPSHPSMAWLAPVVESWRRNWVDRAGQSQEYRVRDFARRRDRNLIVALLDEFLDDFARAGLTDADARLMWKLMTGGEVTGRDDLRTMAAPLRKRLDDLGRELVDLGMLPRQAYLRHLGTYLHRSYLEHERAKRGLPGVIGRKLRSRHLAGDELRPRGLRLRVPAAALTRDLPDAIAARIDQAGLDSTKWQAFERRGGDGRVIRRFFRPEAEREIGPPMGRQRRVVPEDDPSWADMGVWEVDAGGPGGMVRLRRDYTEAERTEMGEIRDVRYAAIETLRLLANDISNGRFFRDIAANPQWASKERVEGWRRMPTAGLPETDVKKWGDLAGMWVPEEIHRDLMEVDKMTGRAWWESIIRFFKISKTALSPKVHFNNVMGNVVMAEFHDLAPRDLARALRHYAGRTEAWREAKVEGVFGHGYADIEILRDRAQPVADRILDDLEGGTAGAVAFHHRLWRALARGKDKAVATYQAEDEVFRLAYYLRQRDLGSPKSEAAMMSVKAFLDYDIRAPAVNKLRRTVLPFLSYMYRWVPSGAEMILTKPWKLAKLALLAWGVERAFMQMAGDDEEEDALARRTMREDDKGMTWVSIPGTDVGLPRRFRWFRNDRHGNPVYLDTDRLVPGGDIYETGATLPGVPAWLTFGGPIAILGEILANRVLFTGDDLYDRDMDSSADILLKALRHAFTSMTPSPLGWDAQMVMRATSGERDVFGRTYSVPAALLYGVGIKLKSHDVQGQLRFRLMELDRKRRMLDRELRAASRDVQRNILDEEEFVELAAENREAVRRLGEKAAALVQ